MAGDPIEDENVTYTGVTSNVTSTDSYIYVSRSGLINKTSAVSTSYTYTSSYSTLDSTYLELLKKFRKIKAKLKTMEGWLDKKPEINPLILRPAVQLRGVCFGGRGWA